MPDAPPLPTPRTLPAVPQLTLELSEWPEGIAPLSSTSHTRLVCVAARSSPRRPGQVCAQIKPGRRVGGGGGGAGVLKAKLPHTQAEALALWHCGSACSSDRHPQP